jgi:purine-binding chemotaxis protein CheW
MLTRQLCTFYLDRMYFGIDVRRVQEVIRYQEMSRVPRAPDEVRGLINLRGQIVCAIDMRRRLKLEARPGDKLPMNVVVRTKDGPISLVVDEIGDVLEVDESTVERPPDTLEGTARELVRCVYKLSSELLLVLDPEQVVTLN